jgi:peptide-methionine (S)-S-oxide reductase
MVLKNALLSVFVLYFSIVSCGQTKVDSVEKKQQPSSKKQSKDKMELKKENRDVITLGAGCFWCVEAVFQSLDGVDTVISGYSGGHIENPTYEEVCSKESGHAEVCRLIYDTTKISLEEILEVYWQTHDPTTLNQQGADKGPQYRSVIFYHNAQQKEIAERIKKALDASGAFEKPIVTTIEALTNFYAAEDYHQNYYKNNPNQGYCYYVIRPKMEKFEKVFKKKMKKE